MLRAARLEEHIDAGSAYFRDRNTFAVLMPKSTDQEMTTSKTNDLTQLVLGLDRQGFGSFLELYDRKGKLVPWSSIPGGVPNVRVS